MEHIIIGYHEMFDEMRKNYERKIHNKSKCDDNRLNINQTKDSKTDDEEKEFVSLEAFEMLTTAYNEIFDECVNLKSKLARVQEIIKD